MGVFAWLWGHCGGATCRHGVLCVSHRVEYWCLLEILILLSLELSKSCIYACAIRLFCLCCCLSDDWLDCSQDRGRCANTSSKQPLNIGHLSTRDMLSLS